MNYELAFAPHGRRVDVVVDGRALVSLSLLAGVDRLDARDETTAVAKPTQRGNVYVVERESSAWEHARTELHCHEDALEVRTFVRGSGALGRVRLLGGRSAIAGAPLGPSSSGTTLRTLFTPNPEDHAEPIRDVREGATIGVVGDSEPGRTHWLFTPAPLYVALGDGDDWLSLALAAPLEELAFPEVVLEAGSRAFALALDYEGHTTADGELELPRVLVRPSLESPYAGIARYRDDLADRGFAPQPAPRAAAAWWSEPIFCGWGAQCYLENTRGGLARDYATQAAYDGFLAHLEAHGVVPGTVVLDDKWQATYGRNEPDTAKWPDLKGWIAARHARGQRVLLWWKAWDPEGLPEELCIRNAAGRPVALDPTNPDAQRELQAIVRRLVGDLDADGFKVDFTARTPTGATLTGGRRWGISLLHELLRVFYEAVKQAKPDALVITHTPHPSFVDVTDMIRLNDMITGDVVAQMDYRAEVVRAACPELPIDTDDWRSPDKTTWRAFLERKPEIGVPSLYYATHIDNGEELDDDDYAAIRRAWDAWRGRREAA